MESLVPAGLLNVGNCVNELLTEPEINHTARSFPSPRRTNYDAIPAASACSLERSTTAAACLPQSTSSFAHTAPTMGDGGQQALEQRATPRPLKAWHALGDVQIHATGAEIRTSAGGYSNGAARASSHLKLPQQAAAEHAAAAHDGCEQHALNRVQRGATGGPSAASAAEDPKRALVHALQNDLSRMWVLLERLDELLSREHALV